MESHNNEDGERRKKEGRSRALQNRLFGNDSNKFKQFVAQKVLPSLVFANIPDANKSPHVHRNVDEMMFDTLVEEPETFVLAGTFLAALEIAGLRKCDQRLKELQENLLREHKQQEAEGMVGSIETVRLDREAFKRVIMDNIVLISAAFRQQFIIPEFEMFCLQIEQLYKICKPLTNGKVASFIPQFARVDPNYWGVSVCTIDGQRFAVGDTNVPFTMQSCSKPLVYAMALNELGKNTVHKYVGQEPSGKVFNELVLDYNQKPHNPMLNSGSIIVCSLLNTFVGPKMGRAEKFDYTHDYFTRLCGGEYKGFNNSVFLSERESADQNYALGFYMREHGCFPPGMSELQDIMDYYMQVQSMEANCESMAIMAATLANGGICPTTGEQVLKEEAVQDVLSLMQTCGMYQYSGQFSFKVGLPAKSGVCGAIMLVVPNVLGLTVWSPPLDAYGNSVRGVAFCERLVQTFNFHLYEEQRQARSNKIDPRRQRHETKGLNIVNLLFAAAAGDLTSIRRHHLSGVDLNVSDYDGRTALHLAAAEGHIKCVEYLLRFCGVEPSPVDRWGHVPIDDAKEFGHTRVVNFLQMWKSKEKE